MNIENYMRDEFLLGQYLEFEHSHLIYWAFLPGIMIVGSSVQDIVFVAIVLDHGSK